MRSETSSSGKAAGKALPDETGEAATVARPRASWPLVVLASLAIVAAAYFAGDVIIPVVLSLLLALLLRPVMRRMRSLQIPDLASAFILIAAVAIVFAFGVLTLAGQAQQW